VAFYQQQGLDMAKVRLEDGSRNTRENASKWPNSWATGVRSHGCW